MFEKLSTESIEYDYTIKNSKTRMVTKAYLDDETKKQQNYLDLYNATIMKNLFESILERQNSTGSPRGSPQKPLLGGSRKLCNAIKKNRTQRKNIDQKRMIKNSI